MGYIRRQAEGLNGKMLHPIKGSYSFFYLILNAIITALFHIRRAARIHSWLKFVPTALAINQARGTRIHFYYTCIIYCTAGPFHRKRMQLFFSPAACELSASNAASNESRFVHYATRNCDACVLLINNESALV